MVDGFGLYAVVRQVERTNRKADRHIRTVSDVSVTVKTKTKKTRP